MFVKSLLVVIVSNLVTANNNNGTVEKIRQLENEKHELLKKINDAIDDSLRTLQKSNETEALIGYKYMADLKDYLKRENEILQDKHHEDNDTNLNNRRYFQHKKKKNDPFDFESVLKPKKASAKEFQEIMDNRIKMQKQINLWIDEREKEKKRVQEYREYVKGMIKSGRYEKCPRFGYKGKRKKGVRDRKKIVHCKEIITDSDYDKNYQACINATRHKSKKTTFDDIDKVRYKLSNRRSKRKKYPCCRKCCKKSYMGCL